MTPQSFQLVLRSGPNMGKTFDLNKEVLSIGRDISNDITINDAEISRKHARLTAQAGGYILEDTGSTNGTFVNGQRLMGPHMLRPGELILLGENVNLAYEALQFDADATLAVGSAVPSLPATPVTLPAEPAAPVYQPPVYQPPVAQPRPAAPPAYAAPVQPAPAEPYPEIPSYPFAEEKKGFNKAWIFAGCGLLVVIACMVVVAALFWIDAGGTDRWCQYLGFLFSSCP